MSPYSEKNNPVLERAQEVILLRCEYDGKLYPESEMLYDKYFNGEGGWIYKGNIEAFAKRELPLYEQEEYINIIKTENGHLQESKVLNGGYGELLHREVAPNIKAEGETAKSIPVSKLLSVAPDKSDEGGCGFNQSVSGKNQNVQSDNYQPEQNNL